MKKGFTLVELLAVLIILAVIGLIAIPIVVDIIAESEKKAAEATLRSVSTAAGNYYKEKRLLNEDVSNTIIDLTTNEIKFENGSVDKGKVMYNEKGDYYIAVYINGYCLSRDYEGNVTSEIMDLDECDIDVMLPNYTSLHYFIYMTIEEYEDSRYEEGRLNNGSSNTYMLSNVATTNIEVVVAHDPIYEAIKNKIIIVEYCPQETFGGGSTCPKDVIIPSKINNQEVIAIAERAFYNKKINNVVFPNTIRYIDNSAFMGNNLTELTIPNSVEEINYYAFARNNIDTLILPNKDIYINCEAFYGNPLTNVIDPYEICNDYGCGYCAPEK